MKGDSFKMSYYIKVVQTWVLNEFDYCVYNDAGVLLKTFENQQDAEKYIKNQLS